MGKNSQKNNNFIKQGSILAAASVLSRIIGLLYRSPMVAIIGDDGNGLYTVAFEIYSIALILSSYSMPLAVSKILTTKSALKDHFNAYRTFKFAMLFSAISGFIMMVLIYTLSGLIEKFMHYQGLSAPLKVLAPTIFVVAIVGTLRGFFQSRKTMIPTAVSQLADQFINAFVSILAAYILVGKSNSDFEKASFGAAGGTLGTLFGALSSLFFLGFLFVIYRPTLKKQIQKSSSKTPEPAKDITKSLFFIIIPIVLSQTIYQASGIIDSILFGNLYQVTGSLSLKDLYGIYGSKYRLMVNVPNAIASAMASSMIPTLVSLYTLGRMRSFKERLYTSVKFNMIIAFPCALGLAALGTPILRMLFPTTDYIISGQMLLYGSIAVVFYALSTVTNAALQGLDRMRLPVRHAAISLIVHIILVCCLLKFSSLGVYSLVVGNVTYPLLVCILNWYSVAKHAHYKQELRTTFVIPAFSACLMGLAAAAIYYGFTSLVADSYLNNAIAVLLSISFAIPCYFSLVFIFKGLSWEELADFPMGMRIGRLAKKAHLLK